MKAKQPKLDSQQEQELRRRTAEVVRRRSSSAYFANNHCNILASGDGGTGAWVPFRSWPARERAAVEVHDHREIIILKARQLGFTWLVISFALQQLLVFPVGTVLLFSKRDDEAAGLLEFRLREMYMRLPDWMRLAKLVADKTHKLEFPSGSRVMAFSTAGGRSYTATLAIVDEADHVLDLEKMLNAIKPTLDAGGRLIFLTPARKAPPRPRVNPTYPAPTPGPHECMGAGAAEGNPTSDDSALCVLDEQTG